MGSNISLYMVFVTQNTNLILLTLNSSHGYCYRVLMLKKEDNFVLTNEFPIKLEICSLTQNWGRFPFVLHTSVLNKSVFLLVCIFNKLYAISGNFRSICECVTLCIMKWLKIPVKPLLYATKHLQRLL